MIEDALYARLSTFAGLTTLVGTRIYPLVLPQNPTYPAVTFGKVSALRESAMGVDTGDVRARVQIDAWGESDVQATDVAAQVKAAIKRFRGPAAGVTFGDVFLANELNRFEEDGEVYRVIQDYEVWYKEA